MKLLEVDDNHNVRPNKEWLVLIPEFAVLYRRDPDRHERRRFKKEIIYIYFLMSFDSPIRDYQPEEKDAEALNYAQLIRKDIDKEVRAACAKYEELQLKASRSLRTLRSMWKGLEAADTYFENVDFEAVDKKGELVNSTERYMGSIIKMGKVYDELAAFEKRVENDLKNSDGGIRGMATLGDLEARKTAVNASWNENDVRAGSERAQEGGLVKSMNWRDIQKNITSKLDKHPKNPPPDELSPSG